MKAAERIELAAIRTHAVQTVWRVDRPKRHCDIINEYARLTGKRFPTPHTQGFITSQGRFVDRKEAATIAHNAGQIEEPKRILYSEDVW